MSKSALCFQRKKIGIFEVIFCILFFMGLMLIEPAFLEQRFQGRWSYYIDFFIIILSLLYVALISRRIKVEIIKQFSIYLMPYVLLFLWSICFCSWEKQVSINSMITYWLYWLIPIVMSFSVFLSLQDRSIDILFFVIVINYFCVILQVVQTNGIDYLFRLSTYTKNYGSLLEVHQIGLTMGLFLIFYFYTCKINGEKLNWKFWCSLIVMLMCGKRIALVAVVCTILLLNFIQHRSKEKKISTLYFISFAILLITFIYICLVKNGVISLALNYFNINSMSRIEVWRSFSDSYKISPSFIGNGIGYCMNRLVQDRGIVVNSYQIGVGDLHNDILKMYIEVGFIPFVFYFAYILIIQLRLFIKKKKNSTAILYLLLITYTIVLAMTDNILRYNLFLFCLYLIPSVELYRESSI